jgi:glutamyl/glutaminyl-tRNA synthetase
MKAMNCRFCPTTNGNLHMGHIYVALVNYTVAKMSGGEFTLRFDDNQEIWSYRQEREESDAIADQMKADLKLFGIEPDYMLYQSREERSLIETLTRLNGEELPKPLVWSDASPDVVGNDIVYCAYNYPLTAEKVAWDFITQTNCLIRGEDLITEACLYSAICEKWRLPQPRQIYLPRLLGIGGNEISKSKGFPTIRHMIREGWRKDNIMMVLIESCLINPKLGWTIDNIKSHPQLTINMMEKYA